MICVKDVLKIAENIKVLTDIVKNLVADNERILTENYKMSQDIEKIKLCMKDVI